MALEIERRFLVDKDLFPSFIEGQKIYIKQGYVSKPEDSMVVRVRSSEIRSLDPYLIVSELTIKRKLKTGINKEFEFEIPNPEAIALFEECGDKILSKTRCLWRLSDDLRIEIDFFHGKLEGVVIAEIEVDSLDRELVLPSFLTKEITTVKGLSNFDMVFNTEKALEIYADQMRSLQ